MPTLEIFAQLRLMNGNQPHRPDQLDAYLTIGPGKYEFEKVDNPVFGPGRGSHWFVLFGSKIGLPCSEFERRLAMSDTCQLRVRLVKKRKS